MMINVVHLAFKHSRILIVRSLLCSSMADVVEFCRFQPPCLDLEYPSAGRWMSFPPEAMKGAYIAL